MENLSFELTEVLIEVVERMKEENFETQEHFNQIVDEVMEERKSEGILPDDYDTIGTSELLKLKWSEVKEKMIRGE